MENAGRGSESCEGSLVMLLQGSSAIPVEASLTFWGGLAAGLPTAP